MRKRTIVLALVTALLFVPVAVLASRSQTTVQAPQTVLSVDLNADTIFDLVNAERTKNGLQPLVRDSRLDQTAQARADDMVARNYFAHRDPVTGENMVKALPYCNFNGENISAMYDNSGDNNRDAVIGWMNSKPHHDAILDTRYTTSGIAVSGDKTVQLFCIAK